MSYGTKKQEKTRFAYANFKNHFDANQAFEQLNSSIFQGYFLHLQFVFQSSKFSNISNKTKQLDEKTEKRKGSEVLDLTNKKYSWKSFVIGQETILEAIAEHYRVDKTDLLGNESYDAVIRLSLGETLLIVETKRCLVDSFVDITKLERVARHFEKKSEKLGYSITSSNVIMVKKIPLIITNIDLIKIFGQFGHLIRVVFPYTKIIALIEYLESNDARLGMR